jgi:hypothetical protein
MVTASTEILGDAERWRAMSEAAAADARARFSRDQIVSQYEALYIDAITGAAALSPTKAPA